MKNKKIVKAKKIIKSEKIVKAKRKVKRKSIRQLYCKRCGIPIHIKFKSQITPKKEIDVCHSCFIWSTQTPQEEVVKDYNGRTKKSTKKR